MKLKSGREVKLKDLTMAQRIECQDIATVKTYPDGAQTVLNQNASVTRWCMYGLGKKTIEDLVDFTDEELSEIFVEVRTKAFKGLDPTK